MEECVMTRFYKDVLDHKMEVARDDGLYRHLKCRRLGTNVYWFDIVTWPGHLAITGDMGSYTFTRLKDMFEFFRSGILEGRNLRINCGYWAEKCVAACPNGKIKEFSPELFTQQVKEMTLEWVRENRYDTETADRRELWDELVEALETTDSNPIRMYDGINEFEFAYTSKSGRRCKFFFRDLWEVRSDEYTFHFQWCLYAIIWAIREYDRRKS